jgi:exodeoxyribonuclease VII small subunit
MPKKTTTAGYEKPDWSYENAVAAVESIIADLESGQLPLAEVLSQFEMAVQALKDCENYLQSKQKQVDLLIETLGDD